MRLRIKRTGNQKGLTLVELLAVIVILGIIAAIAVPAIGSIIENSRKDAQIANAENIYNAARLAVASESIVASDTDTWTFYATEAETDNTDTSRTDSRLNLLEERYLDTTPQDPHGDGVYTDAYITYDGSEYTVVLNEYFGAGGTAISTIRSSDRDIVNLD
ncbi:type II secretion system protein [Salisediminibacterium selenitireducens]|uniref:Prepilin-type N-terminal cleavage/methylation domain-containing protein n=1 Tax=Bacillus selenitireducens (strain ATCC 700615 / DSM 15326 / MLS10) TaxID=439292 RepID=D6XT18_BACIE|nr:prepilin-type N-terminal cleavage/methylation domain-containing protein [Salisediminibacterium selenitireducens]ADH98954.1 conserved hypothetical protein [[Bacillus] selenitireducens MLS10]